MKNNPSKTILNKRSKRLFYVFIAFLIGIVQAVEDLTHDDASSWQIVLEAIFIIFILTLVLTFSGHMTDLGLQRWRKTGMIKNENFSTIVFGTFWVLIGSLLFTTIAHFIQHLLGLERDHSSYFGTKWVTWVTAIIVFTIAFAVEFFWEVMRKRQSLELLNERLLRNQEIAKYQALMNQVNPHFLFNSLNVLSFLVYKNPKDADRFIEELSKIYRYILQLNEAYVVPLKEELKFIQSYIYLQKIRYQGNLNFESEVAAHVLNQLIPPLTLEVLIENAIKHNIISEKQPLNIQLTTQGEYLIVKNEYQPRIENEVTSTKVGLKNLTEKFAILESAPPEFVTKNGYFVAKVPLLQPEM